MLVFVIRFETGAVISPMTLMLKVERVSKLF